MWFSVSKVFKKYLGFRIQVCIFFILGVKNKLSNHLTSFSTKYSVLKTAPKNYQRWVSKLFGTAAPGNTAKAHAVGKQMFHSFFYSIWLFCHPSDVQDMCIERNSQISTLTYLIWYNEYISFSCNCPALVLCR